MNCEKYEVFCFNFHSSDVENEAGVGRYCSVCSKTEIVLDAWEGMVPT